MKVFIATPSYDGKPCADYTHSLLDTVRLLDRIGVEASVTYHLRDAYVHRARNSLVRKFLASDATDLFFIDADEGWSPDAPARMLALPYAFVGGAYPFKSDPEDYPCSINSNEQGTPLVDPATGCISATMLPSGFWRLKRSVFETMAPHCDWYWEGSGQTTAFFETPIVNHEWIGEDPWFCRKWLSLGGEMWLYPNIDFIHSGGKEWHGNYHEYLLRQPGGSKAAPLALDESYLKDQDLKAEELKSLLGLAA